MLSFKPVSWSMLLLIATSIGAVRAQSAAAGTADGARSPVEIVNNVVGAEAIHRARGLRGPAGPAGPQGPSGTTTVQVVAECASCASGDGARSVNPALGPIAGALVAGLFGLLGLVIAKENKTSEFRQAWVDALRSDIADFAAAAQSFIYYVGELLDEKDPTRRLEYQKILTDVHQKVVQTQMSIRLRVNPRERNLSKKELNDELLEAIEQIRVNINDDEFDAASSHLDKLHERAAPILKTEWDRVKRGEPSYIFFKAALGVLIVLALIAFCWTLVAGFK